MKTIVSLFVGAVLLAMAMPAEAQYASGSGRITPSMMMQRYRGYGSGYGYYDPAYLQQMMSLPEALAACSVDFSTGKTVSCRPIAKNMASINSFGQNNDRNELLGTVHAEKGKLHFRPFDDTNRRIGSVEAGLGLGVLSAGATHVATSRMTNRGAANAITMGVGSGVGLLTWWKNHGNRHDNCLMIEPTTAQSGNLSPAMPIAQVEREEPVQKPAVMTAKAMTVSDKKIVRNRFEDAPIRVYDGASKILELSAGDDGTIEVTSSSRVWGEAKLMNPSNRKMEWVPLQLGKGIDPLPEESGWVLGNPSTRPNLN